MENKLPLHLQEVIFSSRVPKVSSQISKLVKAGVLRKIAPRVYSPNKEEASEAIIRRNIFQILGNLYPGVLLSHRSAFEFQPTKTGQLFLTTTYTKKVHLPGITLQFIEGQPALDGDNKFSGELFASQRARAFLENLEVTKKSGSESKCLPLSELEERLEQIIRVHGEDELNQIRDRAREISVQLEMPKEFKKLDRMVSALLSTKPSKLLASPLARARAFGLPYDPARLELFEMLFRALKNTEFPIRKEQNRTPDAFRNFAFFESYFSNYIEGTVFEIDEAKRIIQMNSPLPARNEDSHDVLGTYQLVSNRKEMQRTPSTADEFLQISSSRHSILMRARLDKNPGQFKDKNNFAGSTSFVDFNLVRGTLLQSFDFYKSLDQPFAKASYLMFVLTEVHPYLDGNGRLARIMMNAELVAADQAKIIIPTVFRDDYMGALKKLTRQRKCEPFITMLQRAHSFSANVYDESLDAMQNYLHSCRSFLDDSSAILKIVPR